MYLFMCYSNGTNTLGMGNVVIPTGAALTGAEQADNGNLGSGDIQTTFKSKKGKKNISNKKSAPYYGAELPYIVYVKNNKKKH